MKTPGQKIIRSTLLSISYLLWTSNLASAEPAQKPVNLKAHVDSMIETDEGASLHKGLSCMGFKGMRDGRPYVLLRIKSFDSYKELLNAGEVAYVIFVNPANEIIQTVTYYNPISRRVMVLIAAAEKEIELPNTPFPTAVLLEKNYKPFVDRMFLIHTPKRHPGTQYAHCE